MQPTWERRHRRELVGLDAPCQLEQLLKPRLRWPVWHHESGADGRPLEEHLRDPRQLADRREAVVVVAIPSGDRECIRM